MGAPTLLIRIVSLLTLLVLVPYGFARHHLFRYRLRTAAESRPCPSCRHGLGSAALQAADDYWRAQRGEHHGDPVLMVIHRRIYAICGSCGARLGFRAGAGGFERTGPTA